MAFMQVTRTGSKLPVMRAAIPWSRFSGYTVSQ
jgi:hypothetical protein